MATIKEVAEQAQVSSATVSRVLNNDLRVSEMNRQKVLQAVAKLGYRPNRIARSLRRQTSETIGVVVSDIENPHFTQAVRAIEDAAFKQGYRVILCNTDETSEKQRAYLEMLAAEQVVGIILAPADPDDSTISALIDDGIPVVAFDRTVNDERADAVFTDNVEAGRLATRHLLDQGCRRVGTIAGRLEIQTGADRLRGYQEVMEQHGMTPIIGNGGFRLEAATQATAKLLHEVPDLDGLVVANNLMAVGALRALRDAGKRIPEEVALVGIDDPAWAGLVDPSMTTLAQPIQKMATRSFELLVDRITRKRTRSRFEVFHCELRVRQSCGGRRRSHFPDPAHQGRMYDAT